MEECKKAKPICIYQTSKESSAENIWGESAKEWGYGICLNIDSSLIAWNEKHAAAGDDPFTKVEAGVRGKTGFRRREYEKRFARITREEENFLKS